MLYMSIPFFIILASMPLNSNADCVIGDFRREHKVIEPPDGARCVLVFKMTTASDDCADVKILGEAVFFAEEPADMCERIDRKDTTTFRCACTDSCIELFNLNTTFQLGDSNCEDAARNVVLRRIVPLMKRMPPSYPGYIFSGLVFFACAATAYSLVQEFTDIERYAEVAANQRKAWFQLMCMFFVSFGGYCFIASCVPFSVAVVAELCKYTTLAAGSTQVAFSLASFAAFISFIHSCFGESELSLVPARWSTIFSNGFFTLASLMGIRSGFVAVYGYATNALAAIGGSLTVHTSIKKLFTTLRGKIRGHS